MRELGNSLRNIHHIPLDSVFGKDFLKLPPADIKQNAKVDNKPAYRIPDLAVCRAYWATILDHQDQWQQPLEEKEDIPWV